MPFRKQDVLGFDIPMHDSSPMGVRQRVGHLPGDADDLVPIEGTGPIEHRA